MSKNDLISLFIVNNDKRNNTINEVAKQVTNVSEMESQQTVSKTGTAKNNVISSTFLVWKFCGIAQFPHSFGRFARNYAKTAPFYKISTLGN